MNKREQRPVPYLIGLGVLLLYLAFPSHYHNFDGVACAMAVELGDLKHLLHGNHLIYGLTGFLVHRLQYLLGIKLDALWTLQFFDSALAAGGAALLYRILRREDIPPRLSAACSAGLALSFGYWMSALEAQVYMMGAFCLTVAAEEALKDRPDPRRLALKHALAMLTHGANALFAPAALYALYRASPSTRKRDWAAYFAIAAGTVIAAYLLAGVLVIKPGDMTELRIWLGGSAALDSSRTLSWHGAGFLSGALSWLKLCALLVSPSTLLSLPLWLAAAWTAVRRRNGGTTRFALLWLLPYALFFSRWEPETLHFRVNDLIPLWILAAGAFAKFAKRAPARFLAPAYAAALLAFNLSGGILKISGPEKNAALGEARWIASLTPEGAWVAADGIEEVYIPYFAHRKPLILRFTGRAPEAMTERLFAILSSGERVFVTSKRLRESRSFPPGLGLASAGRRGDLVLYEITSLAR